MSPLVLLSIVVLLAAPTPVWVGAAAAEASADGGARPPATGGANAGGRSGGAEDGGAEAGGPSGGAHAGGAEPDRSGPEPPAEPDGSPAEPGRSRPEPSGRRRPDRSRPAARPRRAARPPLLSRFALSRTRLFAHGVPLTVAFRVDGRAPTVRVRLVITRERSRRVLRTIDQGERATGRGHRVRLGGLEGGELPGGRFVVRLAGRDPSGQRLLRPRRAAPSTFAFARHRFPLAGPFTWGGAGARFGAERPGHVHQGQDLLTAEGTAVVAPRGGTVRVVAFQAGGAGNYVVVRGEGEDRDYVFMHLGDGSVPHAVGARVRTGQLIGTAGQTGTAGAPHLHFEIWEHGGWYERGRPVDPLPQLEQWAGIAAPQAAARSISSMR